MLLEYSLALSVLFTRNRSERTQRTMNIGRRMMDVVRNVNLTFQVRFDTWFVQNDPRDKTNNTCSMCTNRMTPYMTSYRRSKG